MEVWGMQAHPCFPNSFQKCGSASDDCNWALLIGDETNALIFESLGALRAAESRLPEIKKCAQILAPDNSIYVLFKNAATSGWNCYLPELQARLIRRKYLVPLPPSSIGEAETKFLNNPTSLPTLNIPTTGRPLRVKPFSLSAIPLQVALSAEPVVKPVFIEGVLDACSKVILAGPPKVGKSRLALNMAFSLSTGTPFLDMDVPYVARVLYVQFEIAEHRFHHRVREMAKAWKLVQQSGVPLYFTTLPSLRLDTVEGERDLSRLIALTEAEVVILDPLSRIHLGDEVKGQTMDAVFAVLDDLILEHDVGIVVVHHVNKNVEEEGWVRVRGSSVIPAWADSLLVMDTENETTWITGILRNAEGFKKAIEFTKEHKLHVIGSMEDVVRKYAEELQQKDPSLSLKDVASATAKAHKLNINKVYRILQTQ